LAFFKEIDENPTVSFKFGALQINTTVPNNVKISISVDTFVNRTFFFPTKVITNAFSCRTASTKWTTSIYAMLTRS